MFFSPNIENDLCNVFFSVVVEFVYFWEKFFKLGFYRNGKILESRFTSLVFFFTCFRIDFIKFLQRVSRSLDVAMLKNLVKKFKTHSLDDDPKPSPSQEICQNSKIRKTKNSKTARQIDLRTINPYQAIVTPSPTAIKNCPLCTTTKHDSVDFERDSGTESDEELEQIETSKTQKVTVYDIESHYISKICIEIALEQL